MTKKQAGLGAAALIPVVVGAWIQIDNHMLERKRAEIQMQVDAEMAACEEMDGHRWFRGECIETELVP